MHLVAPDRVQFRYRIRKPHQKRFGATIGEHVHVMAPHGDPVNLCHRLVAEPVKQSRRARSFLRQQQIPYLDDRHRHAENDQE